MTKTKTEVVLPDLTVVQAIDRQLERLMAALTDDSELAVPVRDDFLKCVMLLCTDLSGRKYRTETQEITGPKEMTTILAPVDIRGEGVKRSPGGAGSMMPGR